jgi:hypothetical protein
MLAQEFTRMSQSRLIGTIALVTWLLVALPVLLYHMPDGSMSWQWIAVYLSFGMLFALDLRRPRLLLLALASAAALYLVVLRCNGYEGALLALVAMQLGTRVRPMSGIAWILGQTALLGIADAITFNPHAARLLLPPYLGLQLVAFFVFDAMAREVAARTALAASNAERFGKSYSIRPRNCSCTSQVLCCCTHKPRPTPCITPTASAATNRHSS